MHDEHNCEEVDHDGLARIYDIVKFFLTIRKNPILRYFLKLLTYLSTQH